MSESKKVLTFEDMEPIIGPRVLTLPEGVTLNPPDASHDKLTYKPESGQKYSDKELVRMSLVLQFLGTEYVTALQWDRVASALTGVASQRPVKRVYENRTSKNGLFRIPLHVLPKDVVKKVMTAKKELVAAAKAAAKEAAKVAPKPEVKKKDDPKPVGAKAKSKKKTPKLTPVKADDANPVPDAEANDGVQVPCEIEDGVEILTAAE